MYPSKLWIAFSQQVWNARRISRKSSGSKRTESAVEPTMSQKSAVIFRRSGLIPLASAGGGSKLGNCDTSRSLRENSYRLSLYSIMPLGIHIVAAQTCTGEGPAHVRFGSKADICGAQRHVRFTPNSDRKSGHDHCGMSALPPIADMCGAK